jgi:uncharacterized protein YbjT (DUF2867 family)
MTRRVLLLGATGLVGGELLRLLADEPTVGKLTVLSRRPLPPDPRIEQHEFTFDPAFFAVDQIFCALGTTIAKAGSQEEFRRIDHDLPLAAARLGLDRGAQHFLLVSALGANRRSRVFYNRVKGEVEEAIIALGYRSVTIARPSLLLGPRAERRRGEEIAKRFGWLMPPKYRPIEAADVARALAAAARVDEPGLHVVESKEMRTR